MDRLRSLEYFIASAEEGSFSAAARRLGVTIPAIANLVNGLERSLGVVLFERSPQGLKLTATGSTYLDACRPSVAALGDLDEQVRASSSRARGTIVIGIQHVAARELLCPALPRFRARHPEIHLDFRESTQMVDADAPGIDVFLSFAWPRSTNMIHRALGISRFVVCASPAQTGISGTVTTYRILRSTQGPITTLEETTLCLDELPVPVPGGPPQSPANQSMVVRGLEPGRTYWFAAIGIDGGANAGDLSNSPQAVTEQLTDPPSTSGGFDSGLCAASPRVPAAWLWGVVLVLLKSSFVNRQS